MKVEKPYYIIDFSATNCFIDIRVNDVSVFCLNIEGQLATIIPINNAIAGTGAQRVNYNVLPIIGETNLRDDVDFYASVWLYDASGSLIEKVEEIQKYKIPQNTTQILIPAHKHESVFSANVPYRIEAWQNSMNLKDIENLRELVDKAYKSIENIFESRQYSQFINMIVQRENNVATSMYLSEEEKEKRVSGLLKILQTGFSVVPTSPSDIMIIHGYGKLVTLKKSNGTSAFLLKNAEGQNLNIELKFHLEQGKTELSVI